MTDLEQMDAEMADELGGMVRDEAKRVLGGNCAFAMDDLKLLSRLAAAAVDSDLHKGIVTDRYTLVNIENARAERTRDSSSDPKGENSRSEVECEASQSGLSESEGIAQNPSQSES